MMLGEGEFDHNEEVHEMNQLFSAFEARHPGFVIQDVKFIIDPSEVGGQSVKELDGALADVVRTAECLDNIAEMT